MLKRFVSSPSSEWVYRENLKQRSSRIFRVSDHETYVITLSEKLWEIFEYTKADCGFSDREFILWNYDTAERFANQYDEPFVYNLQRAIKHLLFVFLNEQTQKSLRVSPANAPSVGGH